MVFYSGYHSVSQYIIIRVDIGAMSNFGTNIANAVDGILCAFSENLKQLI